MSMRMAAAALLAAAVAADASMQKTHTVTMRYGDRPQTAAGEAELMLAGAQHRMAAARGAVVQALPPSPDESDYIEYDGVRVHVQNLREPSCPPEYFLAAREGCIWLAYALNTQRGDNTSLSISWWTTTDCKVHRTVCHAEHSRHGLQYETTLYDFRKACEEKAKIVYQFSYNHVDHGASYYNGAHTLAHGQEELMLHTQEDGKVSLEEFVSVRLFERDHTGALVYKTEGLDTRGLGSSRGDLTGLYAQIKRRLVQYNADGGVKKQMGHIGNYRVTSQKVIDVCPAEVRSTWQALSHVVVTRTTKHTTTPMRMWMIVVSLLLLLASIVVACRILRRRHCHRTQQVVSSGPTQEMGVVQGVVVEPHHQNPSDDNANVFGACSAAPLPPQSERSGPAPPVSASAPAPADEQA